MQTPFAEIDDAFVENVTSSLRAGKPVRYAVPDGGRLHIDRCLPFLCLHEKSDERPQIAAQRITSANAAYLIADRQADMVPLINAIGAVMSEMFGAFAVFEFAELEQDRLLKDDSPFLPPFEIVLWSDGSVPADAARDAQAEALAAVQPRYRSPQIETPDNADGRQLRDRTLPGLSKDFAWNRCELAPIYRQPNCEEVYPDLLDRVVANLYDSGLQGIGAFVHGATGTRLADHRSMGRKILIDAVHRVDEQIDRICGSFDFLLAVTPINAQAAWEEFSGNGFKSAPSLLYRPLAVDADKQKRNLFSVPVDQLEDPVLIDLYQEKQREIDVQLTMLQARGTDKFRDASRVLYGSIDDSLRRSAKTILDDVRVDAGSRTGMGPDEGSVNCHDLKSAAGDMIETYRTRCTAFEAELEIRDDLPAGMMVSGPRLMISRQTSISASRVDALLSHEVGVHLLTYVNGNVQGLRLFRSGLAGYEGVQEGLAVFAEYAVGGLTAGRLRLLAARVLACDGMLAGATFCETFRMLVDDFGFSNRGAFNLTLRVFRSGGFAKDAIYLRGLKQVLHHLEAGGDLEPFWIGKIAASHLPVVAELRARRLLNPIAVAPLFAEQSGAKRRIRAAQAGLSINELISA